MFLTSIYLSAPYRMHDNEEISQNRNNTLRARPTMPKYMFSGSYTKKGVAGLLNEGGSARRDEAERIAKSLGGSLEAYYWCYGETDFMCIMDIPESAKAAKLALTVGASGTFNGKLTPLITVDEMDEICKTDIGEFTLPGQ